MPLTILSQRFTHAPLTQTNPRASPGPIRRLFWNAAACRRTRTRIIFQNRKPRDTARPPSCHALEQWLLESRTGRMPTSAGRTVAGLLDSRLVVMVSALRHHDHQPPPSPLEGRSIALATAAGSLSSSLRLSHRGRGRPAPASRVRGCPNPLSPRGKTTPKAGNSGPLSPRGRGLG